jgi:hypothetical protein
MRHARQTKTHQNRHQGSHHELCGPHHTQSSSGSGSGISGGIRVIKAAFVDHATRPREHSSIAATVAFLFTSAAIVEASAP